MKAKKYVSMPVEIEALKWTGKNRKDMQKFCPKALFSGFIPNLVTIPTLEGQMHGEVGDYIIKGTVGEFYPCKPVVFKKKYKEIK